MHRPILRRAALVALALCTPLAALGNEPQRAAAAPRAALPAFDETFTPPAFDSVERPEFGLSAGTALDVSVEPVVHQASNVFILALAVTVLVVLGTLFATWWLGRTRTPQGNPVWAFTMGSRLTLGFGGLITALMVNFLVATHGMDQVKDVETRYARAIKLSVLSGAAQSKAYFASEATQRFINLENNESLKDVSDALATAHAAIDTMQEVNEGLIDLTAADAMDAKIDAFDQALQQVVQLTDRDNAIVASQMTPAIRRAATVLNETVEAFQSRGDHATATSFANAEAHLHRMRVNFFRYKDTRDTADYDLLVREFNSVNDIMTAQQRTPAGADASKQIAFILASVGFYRERAAEVRTLMEQRAQVMNTQLLPLKKELVDLATVLNNDTATRADELNRESAQTIATSRFTSIVVLIVFGAAAFAAGCLIVITIKRGVEKVLTVLQAVAAGDLRVQPLGNTSNDEIGRLSQATDAMADSLRNMVSELRGTSDQVAAAATEIAASSEEMARGLEQQADQVNQISSAVQEMSASVVEVAQKSTGAADRARNAGNQAQEGNAVVDQTIEGMRSINEAVSQGASSVQELGKRGEQIGEIIKVINDIADQTNLLALNAAIEAARAGEHGRGFAVVADEVRKLAERTQKATEEVGQSIRAIQDETRVAVERMQSGTEQVKVGVEKAQSAGTALMTIVTSSGEVASMIQEIAAAAEQQGSASEEVSRSLEAISSVTREATAGASQAAQAAGELSGKAEQLREVIARFKVAGSETTSAAKAPKPAKKPGKASPVAA